MLIKKHTPKINNGFDCWQYRTRDSKLVAEIRYCPSLVKFRVTFPNRNYLTATFGNPDAADSYIQKFANRS